MTLTHFDSLLEQIHSIIERHWGSPTSQNSPEQLAWLLAEAAAEKDRQLCAQKRELEQLTNVMNGLGEGIILIDIRGTVLWTNQAAGRLLGPFPERTSGRHYIELIPIAEIDRAVRLVRKDGQERSVEYAINLPQPRVFRLEIRKLDNACLILIHDISQQRAAEHMRRDFVANASHEMRTPLTAIQGFADSLLEEDLPADRQRHFIELISKSAEQMANILHDLLLLSKIEHPEHPLKSEEIQLHEVVQSVLSSFELQSEQKNLTVEAKLEPTPMFGDEELLRQVVGNLISNAIRYTPEGGKIWVTTSRHIKDTIVPHVRLVVEDNGIGIPPAERSRVFERFYRVDRGRSRVSGGTGLGLSIVRNIVDRHGGRVWVEERPGGGSRFICDFPIFQSRIHGRTKQEN